MQAAEGQDRFDRRVTHGQRNQTATPQQGSDLLHWEWINETAHGKDEPRVFIGGEISDPRIAAATPELRRLTDGIQGRVS
jgi:hypothetical protein